MSVELSTDGVFGVNDVRKKAEDGHVDRVGTGQRVVVFMQLGEEISMWGMELACAEVAAGFWLTQAVWEHQGGPSHGRDAQSP